MAPKSRSRRSAPQDATNDTVMQDAPASTQATVEEDEEQSQEQQFQDEEVEPTRVKLLPGSTEQAASFEFLDEGHTLGNALRYIIMKNPDVEFCAYAIPHPSEAKMNIRIQTYEGTVFEALEKGLRDLQDLCDVVAIKYTDAREDFKLEMQLEGEA